jgi:hypothetical protein
MEIVFESPSPEIVLKSLCFKVFLPKRQSFSHIFDNNSSIHDQKKKKKGKRKDRAEEVKKSGERREGRRSGRR